MLLDELRARATALTGQTLGELARRYSVRVDEGAEGARMKGKAGAVIEAALGATGGSAAVQDFPDLGVELKTIGVDVAGKPRESTFVCAVSLHDADQAEWATSWARRKLSHVLWVPLVGEGTWERRIGVPLFWRPSEEQEAILAGDFDEIMGAIGIGGVENVTAHTGRWLQLRPKAAHGGVRTAAYGPDGELIATVPRGFYLRARFTEALLRDPSAAP